MSIAKETQEKIRQFAKQQSANYLEAAEMTYVEKLMKSGGQARRKIEKKLARFKVSSEQAREAQDDMVLYMTDYIADLISKGMSEEEAFEMAKKELAISSNSDMRAEMQDKFSRYYENPADMEAVGMLYGGFSILGVAVGAAVGYVSGGGQAQFLEGGWIATALGVAIGAMVGVALGLIANAVINMVRKK